MNYPLAKEIYGTAWSVDPISFRSLSSILKDIQSGVLLEDSAVKLNSLSLLKIENNTKMISDVRELRSSDSFEGVGIIDLNGPITKSGGNSSNGTKGLSDSMIQMSKDNRIKGFVIRVDSGGGATGAVQIMVDAINEVKKTKPVYSVVEKGGLAGSAAYGIISASTGIYSEDGMNVVGSVGTMISFSAKPHGNVDRDGRKNVVLYATKSTEKNKAFEEAVNNDNYDLIINEMLDPINENFIATVLSNRPVLNGSNFDNGHTVFSKDAIGTFIDGIASFEEVVNMVISDSLTYQTNNKSNPNINSNYTKMNKEEFKKENPTAYAEIVSEGVSQEKDRVESWMAYSKADPKAVAEGVASGLVISQAKSHEFMIKLNSMGMLENLESDNAQTIATAATSTVEETPEQIAAKEQELVNSIYSSKK